MTVTCSSGYECSVQGAKVGGWRSSIDAVESVGPSSVFAVSGSHLLSPNVSMRLPPHIHTSRLVLDRDWTDLLPAWLLGTVTHTQYHIVLCRRQNQSTVRLSSSLSSRDVSSSNCILSVDRPSC